MAKIKDIIISPINKENSNNSLTVAELFAGCGGLALGLNMAGFRNIAAVEREEAMCQTYGKNIEGAIFKGDVNDYTTMHNFVDEVRRQVGDGCLDVIAGGFPCQSFSSSGQRIADDPRDSLYQMMVWAADELRPGYVVGENVPSLLSKKFGNGEKVIDCIVKDFAAIGYKAEYRVVDAADFGVPQRRKRLVLIATRNDVPIIFPETTHSKDKYITVKAAISDLLEAPENVEFNHTFVKSQASTLEKFANTKQGERVNKRRNDGCGRLQWDAPAWTLKHNNGHPALHPILNRVLSPREAARIQSFPDDFVFCGTMSKQFEMLGNAVPPLLGKAIGLSIIRMEEERKNSVTV